MPELQLRLNASQHRRLREAATTVGKSPDVFAIDAAVYEADRILVANPWSTTPHDASDPPPPSPVVTVHAVER